AAQRDRDRPAALPRPGVRPGELRARTVRPGLHPRVPLPLALKALAVGGELRRGWHRAEVPRQARGRQLRRGLPRRGALRRADGVDPGPARPRPSHCAAGRRPGRPEPRGVTLDAERRRLQEDARRERHWKRFGPYLSERQWATVREDYSADGDSWSYFP